MEFVNNDPDDGVRTNISDKIFVSTVKGTKHRMALGDNSFRYETAIVVDGKGCVRWDTRDSLEPCVAYTMSEIEAIRNHARAVEIAIKIAEE